MGISTLLQRFACARLSRPCLPGSKSRRLRDAHDRGLYERGSVKTPLFLSSIFLFDLGAHLFVPTLRIQERGAQDQSRTARWRRPKGLSLADRAPRYAWAIEGDCCWGCCPSIHGFESWTGLRQGPWLVR